MQSLAVGNMAVGNPAAIAEARELIERLRGAGLGALLAAMSDPEYFQQRGEGKFNLLRFAQDQGISRRRARAMIGRARSIVAWAGIGGIAGSMNMPSDGCSTTSPATSPRSACSCN